MLLLKCSKTVEQFMQIFQISTFQGQFKKQKEFFDHICIIQGLIQVKVKNIFFKGEFRKNSSPRFPCLNIFVQVISMVIIFHINVTQIDIDRTSIIFLGYFQFSPSYGNRADRTRAGYT